MLFAREASALPRELGRAQKSDAYTFHQFCQDAQSAMFATFADDQFAQIFSQIAGMVVSLVKTVSDQK